MPGPSPRPRNAKTQTELLVEQNELLREIRDEFREDRLSPAAIIQWWKGLPPMMQKGIIWVGIPLTDIVIGAIHPEWAGIIRTLLFRLLAGTGGSPFPTPELGP